MLREIFGRTLFLKCIVVTALGVIQSSGRTLEHADEFQRWQSVHNKIYDGQAELAHRQQVFRSNVEKINTSNQRQQSFQVNQEMTIPRQAGFSKIMLNRVLSHTACAQLALNQFADLTEEEFRSFYLGFKPDLEGVHRL